MSHFRFIYRTLGAHVHIDLRVGRMKAHTHALAGTITISRERVRGIPDRLGERRSARRGRVYRRTDAVAARNRGAMTLRASLDELSGFRPKGCAGKIAYPTPEAAAAAVQRLIAEGYATDPDRMNVYQCRLHAGPTWHVGHRARRLR